VRRKVEGLHQIVTVTERKIVDVYEPKEEGLVQVTQERFLTILEVTLTLQPTTEQKGQPGYHAPLNIKANFLTKESWERGEKERADRREKGSDERGERRERRDDKDHPRRDNRDNRDNREDRGGERRRGRDRRD
jgi:hypothetical protein